MDEPYPSQAELPQTLQRTDWTSPGNAAFDSAMKQRVRVSFDFGTRPKAVFRATMLEVLKIEGDVADRPGLSKRTAPREAWRQASELFAYPSPSPNPARYPGTAQLNDRTEPPSASTALTLGILAIATAFFPIAGLILGIIAIFNSHKARRAVAHSPSAYCQSGKTTAGLVCGIVGLFLSVLFAIEYGP